MKLKLDEAGHVVVQDGKPVYVHEDGKEVAFDAPGTVATITRLNGEAKAHREGKEAAEAKLKTFEGIEDPAAAKKALATVKSLDEKKLIDAGEVDKVKEEAIKAVRAEFEPVVAERDKLKSEIHAEKIGGSFVRSKFATDKLAIPADLVQARFEKHFALKEGRIVAKDSNGNEIYSKARPGELADFDEALEILVEHYPHKDSILKGSGGSGSGAPANGGGNGAGQKSINRATFTALSPVEQAKHVQEGGKVTD